MRGMREGTMVYTGSDFSHDGKSVQVPHVSLWAYME